MTRFIFAIVALFLGTLIMADTANAQNLEDTLYLDLKDGRVVINLRPDLAPKHVARIKELTRKGFYDGLTFHRVIDGFMAQTGDPEGTGMGGYTDADGREINLPAEFSKEPFLRGAMGMARGRDINSASSQFFIMLDDAPHLDNSYTIWGNVSTGMEFVDNIKKGGRHNNGEISGDPDTIVRMQIAADAK